MQFFFAFEPRDYINRSWTPEADLIYPKGGKSYLWQVYTPPPLDGVLVSRTKIESRKTSNQIKHQGIHAFLDYDGPILGDCGAFTYIEREKPPYDPIEMLEYYDSCDFDLGTTVDHLIVPAVMDQKDVRYKITLENAKTMYKMWNEKYQNFSLIGIVQGWDYQSYCNAVEELVETGFDYIGIGGVARRPTRFISKLLRDVQLTLEKIGKTPKIHLFGVARKTLFKVFRESGVTSFDAATMLRQAWLREREGYHLGRERYATIRIGRESIRSDEALRLLRAYDAGQASLEQVMDILSQVEDRAQRENWLKLYHQTLEAAPWKRCYCALCKRIGIDIIVFRGGERNMRRGFHNVWQFFQTLKRL